MPWTKITRAQYQRNRLRYASDLTDREWALIVRQMPPRQRLGRPRKVDLRESCRQFSTFCPPVASGGLCRRSFRRTPRFKAIFTRGATLVDGRGSSKSWSGELGASWAASRSQRRRSSIAKQFRRQRPVVRAALTRAKASMGASATSLPIPTACCWPYTFIPPTCRMSMVPSLCWRACTTAFPSCGMSLPTGFIAANSSSMHSPAPGRSRSSSDRQASKGSNSCRGDGLSSARSLGSADAGASPKTSKAPPQPRRLGFSPLISGS